MTTTPRTDTTEYDLSSFGDEVQFDNEADQQSAMEDVEYFMAGGCYSVGDSLLDGFEEAGNFSPKITEYVPVDMSSPPVAGTVQVNPPYMFHLPHSCRSFFKKHLTKQ